MKMQLSNRTKFIIFLVALLIFGGFVVFITRGGQQKVGQTGGFPPPSIPAITNQKFQVESHITEANFKFPASLPILQASGVGDLTLQEARDIAIKFGYTNDPQILKDTFTGTFYLWMNEIATLDITAKTRVVKYSLNSTLLTSPKRLTENELVNNAKSFILSKGLISDNNVGSFVNYYKLPNAGDLETRVSTNIQGADLILVNFSVNSNGYKVLTLDPTKSPISVRELPDGTISEVDLVVLGNINQSAQNYNLKNFQDFQAGLTSATIISIQDGKIINPDPLTYKIQSVNATNTDLVYLAQQGNNYFSPVFLIKGTANIETLGNVNVYLYLNALK